MATTTFVDGLTVVPADWLNDVNTVAYDPQLATLAGITATQATDLAALSGFMGTVINDATQYDANVTLGTPMCFVYEISTFFVLSTDFRGIVYDCTSTFTIALPPVATAGDGFHFAVRNSGSGVITIDPDGTELIDGAANISFAAGESGFVVCTGTGWIRVGGAARLRSGTTVAATSGTSIDFTGIPADTKRITVMLSTVSTTGTTRIRFQLGDSGGIETAGYTGSSSYMDTAVSSIYPTNGFEINITSASPSGSIVFTRLDSTSSIWTASGVFAYSGTNTIAGTKTLSAELTQIRITTVAGTETFSGGSINILYE